MKWPVTMMCPSASTVASWRDGVADQAPSNGSAGDDVENDRESLRKISGTEGRLRESCIRGSVGIDTDKVEELVLGKIFVKDLSVRLHS
jgi:hypothetical protein